MATDLCNRCVICDVCDLPHCMRPQPPKCGGFVSKNEKEENGNDDHEQKTV